EPVGGLAEADERLESAHEGLGGDALGAEAARTELHLFARLLDDADLSVGEHVRDEQVDRVRADVDRRDPHAGGSVSGPWSVGSATPASSAARATAPTRLNSSARSARRQACSSCS